MVYLKAKNCSFAAIVVRFMPDTGKTQLFWCKI